MKIKVIGKAHLKGTSKKTGNPFDYKLIEDCQGHCNKIFENFLG